MYKNDYPGFGPKEWVEFYTCLNKEVPVEELRLELTEEGKKGYQRELARLKKERESVPDVEFEINYKDYE